MASRSKSLCGVGLEAGDWSPRPCGGLADTSNSVDLYPLAVVKQQKRSVLCQIPYADIEPEQATHPGNFSIL